MNYLLLIILAFSTYFYGYVSVLHTESFVLFIAFFTVLLLVFNNKTLMPKYSKDDFKWNETIQFYVTIKNWHRMQIRDIDLRIYKFLLLSIQLQKYEIAWIRRNYAALSNRDSALLNDLTLRRLQVLRNYKKNYTFFTSAVRALPIAV